MMSLDGGIILRQLSFNDRNHKFGARALIRKLKSGEYRLYSRKKNSKTGRRRNLGTFSTLKKAKAHERAVQFYKHGG
jgi:hypothetical protein